MKCPENAPLEQREKRFDGIGREANRIAAGIARSPHVFVFTVIDRLMATGEVCNGERKRRSFIGDDLGRWVKSGKLKVKKKVVGNVFAKLIDIDQVKALIPEGGLKPGPR